MCVCVEGAGGRGGVSARCYITLPDRRQHPLALRSALLLNLWRKTCRGRASCVELPGYGCMGKFSRLQVLCNFRLWRGGRPEGGGEKKRERHCRHCRPSPLTDKHAVVFSHSSLLFDAILICSGIRQLGFFFLVHFRSLQSHTPPPTMRIGLRC